MKKILKIIGISLIVLLIVAIVVWFFGIRNPYEETLFYDPEVVFDNHSHPSSWLIQNASLIDVEEGNVKPDMHIHLCGDSIAGVYEGEVPDSLVYDDSYDAQGKYVMPGLIDVHIHLMSRFEDVLSILMLRDFEARDSLAIQVVLEQFVRYGVTTVLSLGGPGANNDQVTVIKQLEKNNRIVSPQLYATGNMLLTAGSDPIYKDARRLHEAGVTVVDPYADPAGLLNKKKKLGLDGVKVMIEADAFPVYPNSRLSIETARKIVESADRLGLPVYAHVESFDEFSDAVQVGVYGIMHSLSDSLVRSTEIIDQMKSRGTWYVPTLSVYHSLQRLLARNQEEDSFLEAGVSRRTLKSFQNPIMRLFFKKAMKEFDIDELYETCLENIIEMHRRGIKIALGSDASPIYIFAGYSAHKEMELMSEAGISNADILRIATVNGAKFLQIEDCVGTIERGKLANLLILNENPLERIGHTRSLDKVILKGRLIESRLEPKQMQ